MARIKVFDKNTQSWAYADESFSHIPVKGVDYYTEKEKGEFENFIIDELAKRGQLQPEFVNSIEECTDTMKLYVLPDGYIYAYMKSSGYTNLVPTSTDSDGTIFNDVGYQDGYRLNYMDSGATMVAEPGFVSTGFIPMEYTDIIRMFGATWTSTNKSVIAFYDEDKKPLSGYIGNGYVVIPPPEYFDGVHKPLCLENKTLQSVTTENGESTFNIVYVEKGNETQNPDGIEAGNTVAVGGYHVKYVRISAQGNGADMIVTLNEKIYGNEPFGYAWRNTGHTFTSADYEDRIVALEEKTASTSNNVDQLRQQVQDIIDSNSPIKQSKGSIVTITPDANTSVQVISKITGWDTAFSAAKVLSLRHVKGKNLFDFSALWGGAGTTLGSNGITGVLNANGTITITGTNTIDYNTAFSYAADSTLVGVFPAGTYTLSPGLMVELKSPSKDWTGVGAYGLSGTFTVDEPFWIRRFWMLFRGIGTIVNETRPLYLVAGSAPMSTGFAYEGTLYSVTLTNAISDGEFNWQTGELHDSEGNLVETLASPLGGEITAYEGTNTFISNTGDSVVTYTSTKSNNTSDGSSVAINTFNPDAWGLPVLHLNGNRNGISKENEVTLSYMYKLQEGTCTLKWQGSSSIKWPKKNYTIKFKDKILIKEEWGAQKKYCLKANYIDFSHARNLVCAKLWGQVVKSRKVANTTLNALINAGAVDGFPICLVINGEYQGIYTFNIPKDGWMFGMTGAANDEAIVCAGGADDSSAVLFKKADVVLDTDFDMEYAPDENNTAWIKESLDTLIAACINSDGTDLDTTIAQYLDWDSAIDYICFTVLINGFDCLSKNYILATYGGGKWFFSGYDMDSTFGLHWDGTYIHTVRGAYNNRASIGEFCRLHRAFELVKLYKKDALKARYAELRATILSEDNVVTEFANFIGSIPKGLYDHECTIWTSIPSTAVNNLHQIADFYRRKCIDIDAEMNAL